MSAVTTNEWVGCSCADCFSLAANVAAIMRFLLFLLSVLLYLLPGLALRAGALHSLEFPFLDPKTLVLKTVWGRKDGKQVTRRICKKLEIFLYEKKWRGDLERTDCGRGEFNCQVLGKKKVVLEMDIRQCRVQQFRSYQICLTEGVDVCTGLFASDMKIPYIESLEESQEVVDIEKEYNSQEDIVEKMIEAEKSKNKTLNFFVGNILDVINNSTTEQTVLTANTTEVEAKVTTTPTERSSSQPKNETAKKEKGEPIFFVGDIFDVKKSEKANAPDLVITTTMSILLQKNTTAKDEKENPKFFVGGFFDDIKDYGKSNDNSSSLDEAKKKNMKFAVSDLISGLIDVTDKVDKKRTKEKSSEENGMERKETKPELKNAIQDIFKVVKKANKLSPKTDDKEISKNLIPSLREDVINVMKNVSHNFQNVSNEFAEVIKTKNKVIAKQKVEIIKLGTLVELCLFVLLAVGLLVVVGCLCMRKARWC